MELSNEFKKCCCIAILALLMALAAYSLASGPIGTEWFVNNTNLAPSFPPDVVGTGERVTNITYWANDSAIQLLVFAHANTAGQILAIELFIDGVLVADVSSKPTGAGEMMNKSIVATIPKGANYSVKFFNFHHYEWREYPILTGKNATFTINQTIISNETIENRFDEILINKLSKNDTSINDVIDLNASFRCISAGCDIFTNNASIHINNNTLQISFDYLNTTSSILMDASGLHLSNVLGFTPYFTQFDMNSTSTSFSTKGTLDIIDDQGTISFPNMSGSENDVVGIYANGTLFRNTSLNTEISLKINRSDTLLNQSGFLKIFDYVVPAGTTVNSINITGLNSSQDLYYKMDLELITNKTNATAPFVIVQTIFNQNTSNWNRQVLSAFGSTTFAANNNNPPHTGDFRSISGENEVATTEINIYDGTDIKGLYNLLSASSDGGGGTSIIANQAAYWRNSSAITEIDNYCTSVQNCMINGTHIVLWKKI